MISLLHKYQHHSAILSVEGLPDLSDNKNNNSIGIISSWKLQMIGHPLLEGKIEHLDCLMFVILQYSRHYISDYKSSFVSDKETVSIFPLKNNFHKLLLKSSQAGVKPIELILDDSQLIDLTRCLDDLRYDINFSINWSALSEKPLNKKYYDSSTDPKNTV